MHGLEQVCTLEHFIPSRGTNVCDEGESMPELPLILVVEDDLLRRDVEDALTSGGFAGESFSSGEKALSMFMEGTKNYKALVTDVNLGDGLTGREVARRIRKKKLAFP